MTGVTLERALVSGIRDCRDKRGDELEAPLITREGSNGLIHEALPNLLCKFGIQRAGLLSHGLQVVDDMNLHTTSFLGVLEALIILLP